MIWRRGAPILLLALLCASCAEDRVTKNMARLNSLAYEQLRNCYQTVYDRGDFEAARRRLPADYQTASTEQETDPSIARDPEIAAVLGARTRLEECRNTFFDKVRTDTPGLLPTYYTLMAYAEASLFEVMQKKKSWGDHVRDVKELQRQSALDIIELLRKSSGGLSKDPKDVKIYREQLDKAKESYDQTQKALTTMRRPIMTRPN
ncbi:MAG TPA: hypothetical protein VGN52_20060 [Burkholderiales bacterium]|jgi:hypothetical protein